MTYVTSDTMQSRFGVDELIQLTDPDNRGNIDAAVMAQAIADADGLIESYIVRAVALPLTEIPANLSRAAADITRFYLYRDDPPENVQKRYDEAVRWLKDVAAGKATLGVAADGKEVDEATEVVAVTSVTVADRAISDDTLAGFVS